MDIVPMPEAKSIEEIEQEQQHHQEFLDKRKILEYKHHLYPEVNKRCKDFIQKWGDSTKEPTRADTEHAQGRLEEDFEDANTIIDNTRLPWVPVNISVPWKDIWLEARHLLYTECFTPHRTDGSAGWLSLCIHGMSSVHTNCAEDYNLPDEAEEELSEWTDIAKFCPITVEWMKDAMLYEQFTRVRFMCVLPGGWIEPHRDTDKVAGLGATNVAINNPDGCRLIMEQYGELPFTPGSVFKINTGYNHMVYNDSNEPRFHMIFDGRPDDTFKRKVNTQYNWMFDKKKK